MMPRTVGRHSSPDSIGSPVTLSVCGCTEKVSKPGEVGVTPKMPRTMATAAAAPTYIVTGTITDVWLQEQSATRVQCTIKAKVALSNKKGVLYSENLSSTQERQFIPSASAIESLLSDTLKDLLVPAAKKIQSQIH